MLGSMSEPRTQWESPPGAPEARDTRPWYRKPVLLLVLALFAALVIGALIATLGNGVDRNDTVVPPVTPMPGQTGEPGTEPAVIELNEPATVEGLTVTILRFETSNDVTLDDPPDGDRVLVAYELRLRAETGEQIVGAGRFVVETGAGEIAEITYVDHGAWTPQLQNEALPAGEEVTRWIVFDIVDPEGIVGLRYQPEGIGADPGFIFEHECC
jgi:hypothetical protein